MCGSAISFDLQPVNWRVGGGAVCPPYFTRRPETTVCVILQHLLEKMVYMFLLQLLPLHHGHENMLSLAA